LADDYYVILPTLSGHYEGSADYISKEDDAGLLLDYLHDNGITDIRLLHGTSMGAEVALETARICDIPISHYFFDGGPFFNFPKWFRAVMRNKFQGFVNICKNKTPEDAIRSILKNGFIKALLQKDSSTYEPMLHDFCTVCTTVSDLTVRNITETCYACQLPDFDEDTQKKFLFFFSGKEPARMSRKRLIKKYKLSEFKDIENYAHCGFQIAKPEEYSQYIKQVIEH
ncbi:MAG: alpha/beta hydrolase, partial [Clostridia bacterium]|nr:alpha/beta hydrolase [Clostridia bacterium]